MDKPNHSAARRPIGVVTLLAMTLVAVGGCDRGFVNDEARSALASFLSGVATTAIDGVIDP
jgi:hypothetical protein